MSNFITALALGIVALASDDSGRGAASIAQDREVLRQASAFIAEMKASPGRVLAMNTLAQAQGRCGDREGSRATFEAVRLAAEALEEMRSKTFLIGELAKAQALCGDAEGMRLTIKRARELAATGTPDHRQSLLKHIAESLEAEGDFPGARVVYKEAITGGPVPSFKEALLAGFLLSRVYDQVDRHEIEALVRAGKREAAAKAVEARRAKAKLLIGPGPSADVDFDLALNQAEVFDIAGAKVTVEKLGTADEGALTKAEALGTIALAQIDLGDRRGAAETARAALLLARDVKLSRYSHGETITWFDTRQAYAVARVIEVIARAEGPVEAEKAASTATIPEVRALALAAAAAALAEAGDKGAARAAFARADEAEQRIADPTGRPEIRSRIVFRRARAGLLDDLEKTIADAVRPVERDRSRFSRPIQRQEVCSRILAARAEGGDLQGAKDLLKEITSSYPNARARRTIIESTTKAGQLDEALAFAKAGTGDLQQCQALTGLADAIIARRDEEDRLARRPKP